MPETNEKLKKNFDVAKSHLVDFVLRKPMVRDKIENDLVTIIEDLPGFGLQENHELAEAVAYIEGVADGMDCTIRELLEEEGISYALED